MRWQLKMWKRFNIAEPAVQKMVEAFENHWATIKSVEDNLPFNDLAEALGEEWRNDYANQKKIYDDWIVALNNWIGSCYPAPADRVV